MMYTTFLTSHEREKWSPIWSKISSKADMEVISYHIFQYLYFLYGSPRLFSSRGGDHAYKCTQANRSAISRMYFLNMFIPLIFCLIVFVIGRNKTRNRRLSQSSPYYIAHDVCCRIKYEKRYSVQWWVSKSNLATEVTGKSQMTN